MHKIELITTINSSIDICFDLSRSIDLHQISTSKTSERAIAGVTKGLIGLDETVTWEAIHFGIRQQLTSKITAYNKPYYFVDEQIKGAFKSIHHKHEFREVNGKTIMTDIFKFSSPYGIFGHLFNSLILTKYLQKFLTERNNIIKYYAETALWKSVLEEKNYL